MPEPIKVLIFVMFITVSGGCVSTNTLTELPVFTERNLENDNQPTIDVTYTGTAGALLQIDEHAIMLDPYFSNADASIFTLLSRPSPDEKTVDALLPDISAVSGILIGHAHQDHLLDASYVLSKAPQTAKIYGSNTAMNIIASSVGGDRRVPLNDLMATPKTTGSWVTLPDAHIRILAIKSEHAPQLGPFLLGGGRVDDEQTKMPRNLGWKAGQPLTYIVDFLKSPVDSKHSAPDILYRVFLQSSASGPNFGHPPESILSEHPVNLALLCVASFDNVKNYPEHIIEAVQPKEVVIIHWDNFFKTRLEADVKPLAFLDIVEFIRRAKEAMRGKGEVLMPMPGTRFSLPLSEY